MDDLANALKDLKNGKASGIDDICNEQISHFGKMITQPVQLLHNQHKNSKNVEEKQNNLYP